MIDPTQDGITHVNIYSGGRTALGRMLSNFDHFHIDTSDGGFESVEGLWYWLGIADCEAKECLRNLHGYAAKKRGNELKKKYGMREDDKFEKKILDAIWCKAKANYHLFNGSVAKLPFEHYYNYGGKVVDVKDKYPWLMDGLDKIRCYIVKRLEAQASGV